MKIRTLRGTEAASGAEGHAVIIDVFRAFTTAAFCVAAGAREIVLLADHEQALAMKRADDAIFLTGEIGGKPIAGFDVGNSPSVIEHLDLAGRRVVQRTSAGTQAVVAAAARAQAILLASFVIAGATCRYLAANADLVTLVPTDISDRDGIAREDEACAGYLEALLRGGRPDGAALIAKLWTTEDAERPWPEWFPRRDAELALEIDRFSFALPVVREDGRLIARPTYT